MSHATKRTSFRTCSLVAPCVVAIAVETVVKAVRMEVRLRADLETLHSLSFLLQFAVRRFNPYDKRGGVHCKKINKTKHHKPAVKGYDSMYFSLAQKDSLLDNPRVTSAPLGNRDLVSACRRNQKA